MNTLRIIQYLLPVVFIIFGLILKFDKNPRWDSSRKMSTLLLILGVLCLLGRMLIDYTHPANH